MSKPGHKVKKANHGKRPANAQAHEDAGVSVLSYRKSDTA